jgi:4-hydroxybenzoate polyprenyltransferase
MDRCTKLVEQAAYHAHTSYLFTVSDHKTIMLPVVSFCQMLGHASTHLRGLQILFACVSGPFTTWTRLAASIVWTWLHLLQFNVSNQLQGIEEDSSNKPHRPIPQGRITPDAADRLRWYLLVLCVVITVPGGWPLLAASATFLVMAHLYDSTPMSKHWISKAPRHGGHRHSLTPARSEERRRCLRILHPPGWRSRDHASVASRTRPEATLTQNSAGGDANYDRIAVQSFWLFTATVLSTLHIQDFADVAGDKAAGRETFPLRYPELSRIYSATALVAWSGALSRVWEIGPASTAAFCALGLFIATRVMMYRTRMADKRTYFILNVSRTGVRVVEMSWR